MPAKYIQLRVSYKIVVALSIGSSSKTAKKQEQTVRIAFLLLDQEQEKHVVRCSYTKEKKVNYQKQEKRLIWVFSVEVEP